MSLRKDSNIKLYNNFPTYGLTWFCITTWVSELGVTSVVYLLVSHLLWC